MLASDAGQLDERQTADTGERHGCGGQSDQLLARDLAGFRVGPQFTILTTLP